jgi:hypothetical protein
MQRASTANDVFDRGAATQTHQSGQPGDAKDGERLHYSSESGRCCLNEFHLRLHPCVEVKL